MEISSPVFEHVGVVIFFGAGRLLLCLHIASFRAREAGSGMPVCRHIQWEQSDIYEDLAQ